MQTGLIRQGGILFLALIFFSRPGFSEEKKLPADLKDLPKEIEEFEMIEPHLYRGGQPTERGLEMLKKLGVRTLINFRHEKDAIEWERKKAEELGLRYVSLPWRIQWQPDSKVMKDFLASIKEKEKGPFFFHCRRGLERSGVAEAVYQHYYRKLSFEEAYEKATDNHPPRFYWKPFVRSRYREFVEDLGPTE